MSFRPICLEANVSTWSKRHILPVGKFLLLQQLDADLYIKENFSKCFLSSGQFHYSYTGTIVFGKLLSDLASVMSCLNPVKIYLLFTAHKTYGNISQNRVNSS